jgi:hypothetical protein
MRHDGIAVVKREMNDCPRYATDEKAERDDVIASEIGPRISAPNPPPPR